MEKNLKKDACMCITDLLCCTPEANTTLLINYTPLKNKQTTNHNNNKIQMELVWWCLE